MRVFQRWTARTACPDMHLSMTRKKLQEETSEWERERQQREVKEE